MNVLVHSNAFKLNSCILKNLVFIYNFNKKMFNDLVFDDDLRNQIDTYIDNTQ